MSSRGGDRPQQRAAALSPSLSARLEGWEKGLSELTDAELAKEAERRRRARGGEVSKRGGGRDGASAPPSRRRRIDPKAIAKSYANLELEPGAPLDAIEKAYRRLITKYHPDRHRQDEEKYRTATELAASLTEAYRTLVDALRSPRR